MLYSHETVCPRCHRITQRRFLDCPHCRTKLAVQQGFDETIVLQMMRRKQKPVKGLRSEPGRVLSDPHPVN